MIQRLKKAGKKLVQLVVETEETPEAILALAAGVYSGFSPADIAEVEQIVLRR